MPSVFTTETAKIVGAPVDGCWSQVHTFSPEDSEKRKKRGDLLAVLVISGVSEGVEAVAVGREILGRLHEEYYGNLEGSAFERLGQSVKKICMENEGMEIVAASILGSILYLALCGEGKIILKRKEKIGIILKGEGGVYTASGVLEDKDILMLGSGRFYNVVADGVLKAALQSGSLSESIEVLAPIVLGREDMADAVAILAEVKKEEEIEIKDTTVSEEEISQPKIETFIEPEKKEEKFFSKQKIFVHREGGSPKKKLFILIPIILGIILVISLIIGIKSKNGQVKGMKIMSPIGSPVGQNP